RASDRALQLRNTGRLHTVVSIETVNWIWPRNPAGKWLRLGAGGTGIPCDLPVRAPGEPRAWLPGGAAVRLPRCAAVRVPGGAAVRVPGCAAVRVPSGVAVRVRAVLPAPGKWSRFLGNGIPLLH